MSRILTDEEIIELNELLDDLVENNLAGKRLRRLEEWLDKSEAVRRRYVRFMDLSASLRHYAEECFVEEDDKVVRFDNEPQGLLRYFRSFMVAAAVVMLAYVGFQSYQHWSQESESSTRHTAKASSTKPASSGFIEGTVGQLTGVSDVEWASDSQQQPNPGDSLPEGSMQLETGLAQIELLSGATFVVEGPADFSLSSPDNIYLAKGKLRAIVPPAAAGFTVEMPMGKVIDLGTEFGLHVLENGATEINVFEGEILYEGNDLDPAYAFHELKAGESLFIAESGETMPIDMPSEPFFGAAELAFRSMEEAQRRYAGWVSLSEELADDKQVALYFTFDDHRTWERALRDDARNKKKPEAGGIVGCKWVEGRWPGKGALRFSGENDRVKLKLKASMNSATLVVWMRLASRRKSFNPILHAASNAKGVLAWGVTQSGNMLLRINQGSEPVDFVSPVVLTTSQVGQWVHLATTYDSKQGKVAHYFNGLYKGSENLKGQARLTLNGCDLGNFNSNEKSSLQGQNLLGVIDEFIVLRKALTAEEIQRLYDIGRPFPVPRLP